MALRNAFQLMRNNRFYWLTSYQGNYVCISVTNDFIDLLLILMPLDLYWNEYKYICITFALITICAAFPRSLQLWNLVSSIYAKAIFAIFTILSWYCQEHIFYIYIFYIYISYLQLLIILEYDIILQYDKIRYQYIK